MRVGNPTSSPSTWPEATWRGIEGELAGVRENGRGEVVLFLGKQGEIVHAGREPLHALAGAGLDGGELVRAKGDDAAEALSRQGRAKRSGNRYPTLLVDPVDKGGKKQRHSAPNGPPVFISRRFPGPLPAAASLRNGKLWDIMAYHGRQWEILVNLWLIKGLHPPALEGGCVAETTNQVTATRWPWDRRPQLRRKFVRRMFFLWNLWREKVFVRTAGVDGMWEGKRGQTACKPGSVPAVAGDDHSSGTPVTGRLVRPTRAAARKLARPARARDGTGLPPLFGLAPGGVYRAVPVAGDAVRSYRTLSPLPAGCEAARRRFAFCGTFPGVAPAGRYPAPCFRGARTFLPSDGPKPTEGRPSGRLTLYQ